MGGGWEAGALVRPGRAPDSLLTLERSAEGQQRGRDDPVVRGEAPRAPTAGSGLQNPSALLATARTVGRPPGPALPGLGPQLTPRRTVSAGWSCELALRSHSRARATPAALPALPHPPPAPPPQPSELPLLSKAASPPNYHFSASEAPEPMHFLQDPNLISGGNWSQGPGPQPGGFPPQLSLASHLLPHTS